MAARYRARKPGGTGCGTSLNAASGSRAHDAPGRNPCERGARPPSAATCGPEHAMTCPSRLKVGNDVQARTAEPAAPPILVPDRGPVACARRLRRQAASSRLAGGPRSTRYRRPRSGPARQVRRSAAATAARAESPRPAPRRRQRPPPLRAARRPQDRLHRLAGAGGRRPAAGPRQGPRRPSLATGGYIGASQESNDGDRSVATITYRIPASRWEDALGALRGLATKVVGEQTQATEVGGQIVDLEARLRNLRASEEVLVEIAKGTGKVTDLLEVEAADRRRPRPDRAARRPAAAARGPGGLRDARDHVRHRRSCQVQEAARAGIPATDVDGATATLIGAGQALVSACDLVRDRVAAA